MGVRLMPDRSATSSSADRVDEPGRRTVDGTHAISAGIFVALAVATLAGVVPFAAAVALALLVPAGIVDAHEHRLPDIWLAAALVGLVVTIPVTVALGGSIDVGAVAIGAVVMCAPIALLHLVSPAAMGFGDVKLSIVSGAALGTVDWRLTLVALTLAGLLGATFGVATQRRTIAFGPFLIVGTLVSLLGAEPIVSQLFEAGAR